MRMKQTYYWNGLILNYKMELNIKDKDSRVRLFELILSLADRKELELYEGLIAKEIRLSETAIKEGFEDG